MKFPKNFCIAPFIQHTTHPTQSFSPCPYLGGTVWPGNFGSIHDQWLSEGLENLRQSFLNNEKPSICNRCWNEEDNNKRSLRLRLLDPALLTSDFAYLQSNDHISLLDDIVFNQEYRNGPKILTIKNGNVCNAKCRICHPGDSSKWREDSKKLKDLLGKEFYRIDQTEKNWSESQVEEIIKMSDKLNRIELFGGEPGYNKKVYQIIQGIVDRKNAANIDVYINTNGSVTLSEKMPGLRYFKSVEIGVSIDGINEQFEYGRHGLKFNNVINNIKKMQQYFNETNTKYFIDSISTVSILTVYYLPELKEKVMEILPLAPFWNLLIHPRHLYIQNLPEYVKEKIITKLSVDQQEFQDLINILRQPSDPGAWEEFLKINTALDRIRGESFATTFEDFYKLFNEDDRKLLNT